MSDEIAPTAPAVPMIAKLKFGGIGVAVGLLLGLMGVGKVWMDKAGEVSSALEQVATADKTLDEAKAATAKVEGQVRALKARVSASQAAYAFQRQNYGTAGDHLKVTRQHLDALDATVHGLDAAALDSARNAAKSATTDSAGDLNAQADGIVAVGTAIDALVR